MCFVYPNCRRPPVKATSTRPDTSNQSQPSGPSNAKSRLFPDFPGKAIKQITHQTNHQQSGPSHAEPRLSPGPKSRLLSPDFSQTFPWPSHSHRPPGLLLRIMIRLRRHMRRSTTSSDTKGTAFIVATPSRASGPRSFLREGGEPVVFAAGGKPTSGGTKTCSQPPTCTLLALCLNAKVSEQCFWVRATHENPGHFPRRKEADRLFACACVRVCVRPFIESNNKTSATSIVHMRTPLSF